MRQVGTNIKVNRGTHPLGNPEEQAKALFGSEPPTPSLDEPDVQQLLELAQHPDAPPPMLALMVRYTHPAVRHMAMVHPSLPVGVMRELAQIGDEAVRMHIAANTSAPADLLAELAQDANAKVRLAVAFNGNTPPEVRDGFLHDADGEVRGLVTYWQGQ